MAKTLCSCNKLIKSMPAETLCSRKSIPFIARKFFVVLLSRELSEVFTITQILLLAIWKHKVDKPYYVELMT